MQFMTRGKRTVFINLSIQPILKTMFHKCNLVACFLAVMILSCNQKSGTLYAPEAAWQWADVELKYSKVHESEVVTIARSSTIPYTFDFMDGSICGLN